LNSLRNNYLAPHEKAKLLKLEEDKDSCKGVQCTKIDNEIKELRELDKSRNKEFDGYLEGCQAGNINACRSAKYIHYDLRMKWTLEGNEYYLAHKADADKGGFKEMSNTAKVWHTYPRDPITNEVLDGWVENRKLIHPLGYEVVIDKNGTLVTDPLNIGTYNFYNPGVFGDDALIGNLLHKDYDVRPYNTFGNTVNDPTTEAQRINRRKKVMPAIGKDIGDSTKKATGAIVDGTKNITREIESLFKEEQAN